MRFSRPLCLRILKSTLDLGTVAAVVAALIVVLPVLTAWATQYIGTQNNARSYFKFRNSTSGNWNPLKTPEHYESTQKNPSPSSSNVAYCLDHRSDFPLGNEAYKAFDPSTVYGATTRAGMQAIMEKGYPASTSMAWGSRTLNLDASQARYATANALRAWIYERGGGGYAFMDLRGYDPANSSTWRLVQPTSSDDTKVFQFTLLLVASARAGDGLHPKVTISRPAMTLVAGVYTGTVRVDLTDCNAGFKIKSKSSWLTVSGYTGKSGNVLTLSAPRAYAGQAPSLVLNGYDNRTTANVFWYTPSSGDLQRFVVADYSFDSVFATGRLTYTLPTGSLRIRKIDASDGTPLAGATFRIYQGISGGGSVLIASPVSGADGYAVATLPPGIYSVFEVVPPKGYKVDPLPQTVTVTDGTTTTITMSDQRANGRVFIHKVSSPDGESIVPTGSAVSAPAIASETDLPGAVFTLSRHVPIAFTATLRPFTLMVGGPAGLLTTTLDSPASGDEVTFTAVEPSGGARIDGPYLAGLEPGGGALRLQSTVTGMEAVLPFDVVPYSIGPGNAAVLSVAGPDVSASVTVAATSTVYAEKGQPLFVPPPPGAVSVEATWTAPELAFGSWADGVTTPSREVTSGDLPLSFTMISSSEDASGDVVETTATLSVPSTTQLPLPPADPRSTSATGTYSEVIATLTTGPDGTVMSDEYPPGTYYLQEIAAPKGYELDPTVHAFTLSAGDTAQFKIADRPRRGAVHVVKRDAVTRSLLAGAEFEIDAADGSRIATIATDAEGSVIATGLVPGDYTLTETKAPVGYQLNEQVATFTIDPLSESPTVTVDFDDAPLERVVIEKRNALGKHELLNGAFFDLHSAADDSLVATLVTGADGRAESGLLPLGDYYAVETSAPAGFELDASRHYVTLHGGGGAEVTIQVTDTPTPPDWGGVVVFFRHVWDNTEIAKSQGFDAPVGTDFMPWVRANHFEGKKIADYVYTGRQDIPVPGPNAGGYDPPPAERVYTNAPGNALDANGQPVTIETKPGVVYGQPDPATPDVADGSTYRPFGVLGTYTDVSYVGSTPATDTLVAGKLVLTYWYKRAITGEWKNIGTAPKTGDWRSGKVPPAELAKTGMLSREELTQHLDAAKRKNPEVIGYLNIPGTGIHYPVMQGSDNTKYLTKDAAGADSVRGAIFADVRCSPYVKGDTAARNTILYGHNMKDGSMFGHLDDYGSSPSFYNVHPLIQYVDAAGNGGLWRVYSIRKSTTADSVYTYPVTTPFARRVASWSAASAIDVGFKPKPDGWSLTLSTCTYNRADGSGRILVQGELLEGYSNMTAGD